MRKSRNSSQHQHCHRCVVIVAVIGIVVVIVFAVVVVVVFVVVVVVLDEGFSCFLSTGLEGLGRHPPNVVDLIEIC